MFKMEKVQSGSEESAGIFRDIGSLQGRFKASRVVSRSVCNHLLMVIFHG